MQDLVDELIVGELLPDMLLEVFTHKGEEFDSMSPEDRAVCVCVCVCARVVGVGGGVCCVTLTEFFVVYPCWVLVASCVWAGCLHW